MNIHSHMHIHIKEINIKKYKRNSWKYDENETPFPFILWKIDGYSHAIMT